MYIHFCIHNMASKFNLKNSFIHAVHAYQSI